MNPNKNIIAAGALVLIFPAVLFMGALITRSLQPVQYEPAHTAGLIVTWYAGKIWILWVLLIGLPVAVLVIGCVSLFLSWDGGKHLKNDRRQSNPIRGEPATIIIAAETLAAGLILVIVVVHVLMN